MTIKKLQIIVLSCILSANVLARNGMERYRDNCWPFVATLSLGPAWARPGEKRTLTLQNEVHKTYEAQVAKRAIRLFTSPKGTNTLATGELFLGLRGQINSVVEGQLGLAVALSTSANLSGTVLEDGNPNLNNFTYTYKIRNSRIALKAKTLYDPNCYDLLPYLSGSIGAGFNKSSSFVITPTIVEEVPAPAFLDFNHTAFSYTLGVGLETNVDLNWRVGIGYEYQGWGESRLARASGQRVGNGLHLGNLRAHELQISLSYIA